jgi:uncharacterized protein YkwD
MCSSQSWLKSLPCSFYISIVFCLASGFNFVLAGQNTEAISPACQLQSAAPTGFSQTLYPISSQTLYPTTSQTLYLISSPTICLISTPTSSQISSQISSPPSTPDISETEFKGTVLNVTNFYRQRHNASALTWNDTLANYAQNWANGCQWKHSVGNFSFCIIRALRKLLCSSL